jgi:hypothetical protein
LLQSPAELANDTKRAAQIRNKNIEHIDEVNLILTYIFVREAIIYSNHRQQWAITISWDRTGINSRPN